MPIMMDVENFWLVMAVDLSAIDDVFNEIIDGDDDEPNLDGFPAHLVGMHRPTVELMHAEMAILHPDWEVIGSWRLSDLIVDKLTGT